jgi:hypothetical protein
LRRARKGHKKQRKPALRARFFSPGLYPPKGLKFFRFCDKFETAKHAGGAAMGTVYAEIVLKNAGDRARAEKGFTPKEQIRQTTVKALVDTGAWTVRKVNEPVEIHWKNRETACPAIVFPGTDNVLLGAIPLEDMDLVVNPANRNWPARTAMSFCALSSSPCGLDLA